MNVRRMFFFIMAVFLCFSFTYESYGKGRSPSSSAETIRIGIFRSTDSVKLSSAKGSYAVVDINSKSAYTYRQLCYVEPTSVGIKLGGQEFTSGSILIQPVNGALIKINSHLYRGQIEISKNNEGKLTIINILNLEDYLRGVIKMEICPRWPEESVKAQIVVSRTYALKNMAKHKSDGFDLCSTVHCQVYGGVNAEDNVINKYIDQTQGEVITYRGKLINAIFHGICGGRTEAAHDVWGGKSIPYLKSVTDGFCREARRYNWNITISTSEIQKALQDNGYNVSKIRTIKTVKKSMTGRVMKLQVIHSSGELTLTGEKFRSLIGFDRIRSTLFTIRPRGKNITFDGRGWGHGVGMCQEGARGMAKKGYTYKQIIRHYYPGTLVKKITR